MVLVWADRGLIDEVSRRKPFSLVVREEHNRKTSQHEKYSNNVFCVMHSLWTIVFSTCLTLCLSTSTFEGETKKRRAK